ncbi:DUF2202 domain-containing protein [Candidatus Falkowbacteria bacterium]|jgi:hypothetical protein|nr:DUF2202 domain-containing protein [Candidatus Falkowbacteria bacterium]
MKKNFIKDNILLLSGIFISGGILALVVNPILSKNYNQITQESEVSTQYGPQGYGRGNGQKNIGEQSGKNRSNKGDSEYNSANQQGLNKENCLMDGCLLVDDADYPVGELDQQTVGYLEAALADERKARATYEAVINSFGNVRPFINIIRAEEQHIAMLKGLFDKYGVEIPEDNTVLGSLPSTLSEVCAVGVQAEIDNDQLYQDMIGSINEQDIKEVFTSLAAASLNMHLPAFEKCAN